MRDDVVIPIKFWTYEDVEQYLSCSRSTVYRLRRKGRWRNYGSPRRVRFDRAEVLDQIAANAMEKWS